MNAKKFFVGALLALATVPAIAQTPMDELMTRVTTIIKSGAADANDQIKKIAKENKKDAKALTVIGRAYLAQKDYSYARVYAEQAVQLVIDKKYMATAEPFILLGNIAVGQDNGGEAAQQFQQAIYFDPKNPDGYRRYAQIMSKTDPRGAVQTLEDLRAQVPDYPVDLIAAEICSEAGKIKEANKYYSKVATDKMKDYQISDYATNLFLSQDYEKSLSIASEGHAKFPRNASFNRLMMFNYTEKKAYDDAIAAGERLFNASDSLKASTFDYGYYARALKGADKYQEAVKAYQDLQNLPGCEENMRIEADKNISDCYKSLSDYAKAGEYLDKYLKAQPQMSFSLEESLAQLYADQLADKNSTPEVKKEAYEKADAAYAKLAEKYPTNAAYIANKRATLPFSLPGTQVEQLKVAGPHYVTFADILAAKSDRSAGETKMLINAYNTIIAYYVHCVNEMDKAKEIASKLIELDPENANAKAILGN